MFLRRLNRVGNAGVSKYSVVAHLQRFIVNQNYNKILECDWLSAALIIAFIGQYTRHLRALLYRLFGSFSPAKNVNCYVFIHEDV